MDDISQPKKKGITGYLFFFLIFFSIKLNWSFETGICYVKLIDSMINNERFDIDFGLKKSNVKNIKWWRKTPFVENQKNFLLPALKSAIEIEIYWLFSNLRIFVKLPD